MVDLKRDLVRGADVDLVRVRTTDPDPSYLRITVLNTFDGTAWRPSGRDIPTRAAGRRPGRRDRPGSTPTWSTRRLPVHDRGQRVLHLAVAADAVPGRLRRRARRLALRPVHAWTSSAPPTDQTTAGLHLPVDALQLSPTASAARGRGRRRPLSVFTPNTALPSRLPRSVGAAGPAGHPRARRTKFEQAVALQQWFREDGGFRYSLARPGRQRHRGPGVVPGHRQERPGRLLRAVRRGDGGDGPHPRHPLAGGGGLPAGRQHRPRGHLGLQHPRPARLAGDVLRRRRLGAVRADPAEPHRGRPRLHHPAGCRPRPRSSSSNAPSAAPSVNRVDKTTNGTTPTTAGDPARRSGHPLVPGRARGAAGSCWPWRSPRARCAPGSAAAAAPAPGR